MQKKNSEKNKTRGIPKGSAAHIEKLNNTKYKDKKRSIESAE